MKTRKTLATALIICMIFALTIVGFVGCKPDAPAQPVEKITVVVATATPTEYVVDMTKVDTKKGVVGVLDYLKETTTFTYEGSESQYGMFLTKVGALSPDASKIEFICIYTSVEKDKDVSEYAQTIDYKGVKLTTSGLGISSMNIENNATIYFCISSY